MTGKQNTLKCWMIGIHACVNVRDDSRTAHIEDAVRLSDANNLRCRLVHIPMRDSVPVIVYGCVVPQTLRSGGRGGLIIYVRWNCESLIRLRVENSVHEVQHIREQLRQQTLRWTHKKYLADVPIQIANHGTTVGQANILQAQKAEVRADNHSLLLILTGEHLADGAEQAAEKALRAGWLAPEAD